MTFKLSKTLKAKIRTKFERYQFEVGVLDDKDHKKPKRGERGLKGQDVISSYAGGPVRRTSSQESGLAISEVSKKLSEHLGFNYLVRPFKNKSSDIVKFSNEFMKMAISADSLPSSSMMRRVQNLLQAIVRNPMLRGDYGPNSNITKKIKGFDRATIDTAQLFKAIKARGWVRTNV